MIRRPSLLLFAFVAFSVSSFSQQLTVPEIMAEPSISGMRAEGEKLSPDGSRVIFLWNAEGKMPRDLYLAKTSGGTPVKLLSPSDLPAPTRPPERDTKLNYGVELRDDFAKARENQFGGFEWSPDSSKLVFTHGGDLYLMSLDGGKPKRLTKTQSPEVGARFLDKDRILFSQSGNAFVLNTVDSTLVQLSKEASLPNAISVGNLTPNKTGTMIAYVVSDNSKQKQLTVPNFLPEFVTAGGPRRGWSEQRLFATLADGSRDAPFEIKLPKPEGVSNFRRIVWAADERSLIVDRVDKDTKRRQLFYIHNVGAKNEQIILITEETDDKWQAPLSFIVEPNPKDPAKLFFGSERDGFNHIYIAALEMQLPQPNPTGEISGEGGAEYSSTVKVDQITKGSWQVEWAKWASPDQIICLSTENGYTERDFFTINISNGERRKMFSAESGMKSSPQLDDTFSQPTLLFERSTWNVPGDLYARKVCSACPGQDLPVKLTNTVPIAFKSRKWIGPKFFEISSRDGKKIPAKIYLPLDHSAKRKYPMVIFVHGAGYLQNVINGWNNYFREFMFNEMLVQKGYVVLDIDYRGSAGYGRAWRTDVFDFLGGKDFDDHIDAIDFMVKNYSVNASKVGVYGGSYGGFMAEMLAFRASDKVAAAAALRPVADWKNYYASSPGYTAQRLGFPDKNPEAYKRSSPITYADGLKTNLLILHGMSDTNVHVQDSVQLVEKLIRLGKTSYFELMFYPSEDHGFVRSESWTDEYTRIFAFFEKNLK